MDLLTFLLLYASWYVLTRFVLRIALVYWFGNFISSDDEVSFFFILMFHIPVLGEMGMIIAAMLATFIVPVFVMFKVDNKVAAISEKRSLRLRLKKSDKVGLLSETEK